MGKHYAWENQFFLRGKGKETGSSGKKGERKRVRGRERKWGEERRRESEESVRERMCMGGFAYMG